MSAPNSQSIPSFHPSPLVTRSSRIILHLLICMTIQPNDEALESRDHHLICSGTPGLSPGRCVCVCVCMCVLSHFSRVQLFATPRAIAHQAPLSMGFCTKVLEWAAMPFSRGIFPTQGSNLHLLQLLYCRRVLHCCAYCKTQGMTEGERLNVPLGKLAFPRLPFSFERGDSDGTSSPLWGHREGQVR